jgi:hypothetical protein
MGLVRPGFLQIARGTSAAGVLLSRVQKKRTSRRLAARRRARK